MRIRGTLATRKLRRWAQVMGLPAGGSRGRIPSETKRAYYAWATEAHALLAQGHHVPFVDLLDKDEDHLTRADTAHVTAIT